jgi:hypothetical protein
LVQLAGGVIAVSPIESLTMRTGMEISSYIISIGALNNPGALVPKTQHITLVFADIPILNRDP